MRDSDLAIGGLVLLGIVGALIYFLFPKFITGVLRGPSYVTIIKNQQNELAAFNRETDIIGSYLQDSWTMKAYRKLDAVISRGGYEDWVRNVTTERNEAARDMAGYVDRERPGLETLAQSLESKLSLRDKTKRSFFDLAKSPLDAEIEALQVELDKKTSEFSQFLNRFSEKRRALNQKALTEWFKRSLFVGLLTAGIVVVVCGVIVVCKKFVAPQIYQPARNRQSRHLLVLLQQRRAKSVSSSRLRARFSQMLRFILPSNPRPVRFRIRYRQPSPSCPRQILP